MFGTTIEYLLRTFNNDFEKNECKLLSDGSMHSYKKEFHPISVDEILSQNSVGIATPIYPFKEKHFPEILKTFQDCGFVDLPILLYADSLRSAELNILFQYHKIAFGAKIKMGLGIFCGDNTRNIVNWNKDYTHWNQMQIWELREWFSLFYVSWVQEWIDSQNQVPDNVLKISNTDMLFHTKDTVARIFKFCNTEIVGDIDSFIKEWSEKQQYIVDEFTLLDDICNNTINNIAFEWKPTHIVAEAIVQQRLRSLGYEIQCDGLNTFPVDSKTLYNLLERC
jgi:hypothetical protein